MKSILKWIAILLGGLLGLTVLLSVAVYLLVDIEDYRDDIAAAVSDATGRTLNIDGELSLRSFPCCGVRIGQVSLSNAPEFQEGRFAKAQFAGVSVQILPLLLQQKLLVDELEIDGLDLQLITRRDGKVNWEFGDTPAAEEPDAAASDSGLSGLDIGGIRISNSRIVYRDETTGDEIEVTGLRLETGPIAADEPFDVTAELGVLGLVEGAGAGIKLDTQAQIDLENAVVNLEALNLDATLDGKDLPSGKIALVGTLARVDNVGGDAISFQGLDANVTTAGITAALKGDGGYTDAGLNLSAALNVEPFSPRELLSALGEAAPETADPGVLKKLSAQGQLELAGDTLKLDQLKLKLDDSQATGMLRLASIEKEQLRFELNVDRLDLDRYLAPESVNDSESASTDAEADEALPVETLRALDVNGKLNIAALTVMGLNLSDASINISADDGWIRLKPLTANLYDGAYSGDVRLNVRQYVPKLSLEENMTGVNVGDLLRAFTVEDSSLIGKGNVRFTGSGSGRTTDELIDALTGTVVLDVQEGRYLGTDIWYEVRKVLAGIDGTAVPPASADPSTTIEELKATAKLNRGMRIDNDQLNVLIPFMRITGNGTVDLNTSELDYKLTGKVIEKPVFEDGITLGKLEGLALGIGLKGSIDDPSVKVDFGSLAKSAAKSAIDKKKDKEVNKLLDKFGLGGSATETEDTAGQSEPGATADAPSEELQPTDEGEQKPADPKDQLKDSLRNLFDR